MNNVLDKVHKDSVGFFLEEVTDSLEAASASQMANLWFRDALHVVV